MSIRLKNEGLYTKPILLFIEAHEVAHSALGHTKYNNHNEAEADFLAVKLCEGFKYHKSAKIGEREFKNRHKISFGEFEKKYGKNVFKKLKIDNFLLYSYI